MRAGHCIWRAIARHGPDAPPKGGPQREDGQAIARFFGWLGRRLLLYLLLVVAIGAAGFVGPWVKRELAGGLSAERRAMALEEASQRFAAERDGEVGRLKAGAQMWRGRGIGELDAAIAERQRALIAARRAAADLPPRWRLALEGSDAVLAAERLRLRAAVIEEELASLRAARLLAASNGQAARSLIDLNTQRVAAGQAAARCRAAQGARSAFEARWRWRLRAWIESREHRALTAQEQAACTAARQASARVAALEQGYRAAAQARDGAEAAFATLTGRQAQQLGTLGEELSDDARRAAVEWRGSAMARLRLWAGAMQLSALLWKAAVALALIMASPYLIRLFCYSVLAPIAMRRPSIRLNVPGGAGARVEPAERSTTSVAVTLTQGEELLVRQDYLQSSSHEGAKGTQWFLDWRHPVTSIATGLSFLTRIRGEGQMTSVSAVRDPFAEVTILTLPEGGACVLQPRAIAAVAQPIDRPLTVRTHWRLFSLNAWLTMQLRYVVFHGPARLVVKGGRGVRVERAARGRVFGQAQLVGFSADLAYSVTRTETFWPYLLGREQLLKDKVEAGEGVLVVEEAPMAGRRGEVRHGIEGLIDAGMKVLGM